MGALDCVSNDKMKSTESTEVFTINMGSNACLDEPRRDLESQFSKTNSSEKHSVFWTVGVDIPLVIIVALLIGLIELGVIPSYKSGFYCKDPKLSLPYKGDTVSSAALISTIFLLPLPVLFVTEWLFLNANYLQRPRIIQAIFNTTWLYRSYLYGLFINFFLCEVAKIISGAPRPSFFEICQPVVPDTGRACQSSEYVPTFDCTPSDRFSAWTQRDSYRSFFSGHSSLSVHCGLFIAWYLQRRAFAWRNRVIFVVPFLQAIFLSYAAICSLTRVTDNKHHWWDVLTGICAGIASMLYSVLVLCDNFSFAKKSEDAAFEGRESSNVIYSTRRPEMIS